MQGQALIYAKAINSSVDAAHLGFTVCEDALALVECISQTTAEDRNEFLKGVKALTQKGYDKAVEAKKGFIHVRTTVEEVNNSKECAMTRCLTNNFFPFTSF